MSCLKSHTGRIAVCQFIVALSVVLNSIDVRYKGREVTYVIPGTLVNSGRETEGQ